MIDIYVTDLIGLTIVFLVIFGNIGMFLFAESG